MDTFENLDPMESAADTEAFDQAYQENQPQEEQAQEYAQTAFHQENWNSAYHGKGTGRKESPFASSPYESVHHQEQTYRYQPQTTAPVKPKKEKKSRAPFRWKGLVAVILAAALVAGSCFATAFVVNEYWEERHEDTVEMLMGKIDGLQHQIDNLPASTDKGTAVVPSEGMTPGQLYSQCVESVVAITSVSSYGESGGSGFVLSEDGYILTNYHVVEGAETITVTTHDGSEYEAVCVGNDSSTNDLALLKIDTTGLRAAKIGKSGALSIGDMVVAIGNPLGELTSTMTVGYVSGVGREVATDSLTTIRMIQTDAAINPGNSGGPLFNMNGEVIGITTAKYSGTTTSGASIEGIGFAIPIDDVMSVVDDLIQYGYVTGAYMGVSVQNTDEASAAMFGLPTGAYIVSVEKGGAADRAGIKAKDIVIGIGEYKVSNVTDLTRALRNFKAGDTTTVIVLRSGQEVKLEITLDEKPNTAASNENPTDPSKPSDNYDDWHDYYDWYFGD
ncbi:MAG: trypsin-like peptidase domain-containing protein [Oscillospiraceae bacterium]|nr:trypsin-like peptidase domain-containing protein [Oscillospiraceae bacterium]